MNDILSLVNSKHIPKNFPREFDVHVYFDDTTKQAAEIFADKMKQEFADDIKKEEIFVGYLINKPVGPHPLPMFEANFKEEHFQKIVLWMMKERGDLNILVHPLSGDDFYDHTQGAIWLGESVELIGYKK